MALVWGINIHSFVTDIHNPKLQRHFALIGQIPILWSEIEFGMANCLTAFNGDSNDAKKQLFMAIQKLGNRDRPDLLLAFNEMTSLGPKGDACVTFAVKAFGILLQNRNALLHSHAVDFDANDVIWTRFASGKKSAPAHVRVPLRALRSQVRSFERLRNFLMQLFAAIWAQNHSDCSPPRWPRIFPQPKLLETAGIHQATQARAPRKQRPPRAQKASTQSSKTR